MGLSVRHFLLDEDDALHRLPQRVVEGLIDGKDKMPQYAGETVRGVSVTLEIEAGKPKKIVRSAGEFRRFDEEGKIDRRDLARSAFEAWELADTEKSIDASAAARVIFSALRQSDHSLSTHELTQMVMAERGLNTADRKLVKTIGKRVGSCLRHHRSKGTVRSAKGPESYLLWEIAGRTG